MNTASSTTEEKIEDCKVLFKEWLAYGHALTICRMFNVSKWKWDTLKSAINQKPRSMGFEAKYDRDHLLQIIAQPQ